MDLHARRLGEDVRELAALLGAVLEDQSSSEAFDAVEHIRRAAIDYRRGEADSREAIVEEIAGLSPALEGIVARAFTSYFELINLAEERERVRAIRRDSQAGALEDSLDAAAAELAEADRETVERVLADVLVEPTFTAHPTEARRKTVKSKLRTIADRLEALDERRLTDLEREQVWREVEAEVTALWQTPQLRKRRPEPEDEARNVQWYLEHSLFDVVGEVYDELERALAEHDLDLDVPTLFTFRSWAGSDRDGNPFVTPEVTANTLERQRHVALSRFHDEVRRLSSVLSQEGHRIDVGPDFQESLEADRERLPGTADAAAERYPDEPYRQKLYLMAERLRRVEDVRPGGYDDVEAFVADLSILDASLRANGAETVAEVAIDPLVRCAETFGFTLAALDLRDHREQHTSAIDEALAREDIDYRAMDEPARQAFLTEAILQADPVLDVDGTTGLSEDAARVLTLFASLADWHHEYGAEAVDTYCISMTEQPSHVLEVLFLADQAGVVSLPGYCGVDVVPLLETESALSRSREIMGTLFENEAYGAAVDARGGVQEVMIGYSDSNKENGFLAANWSLYRNQRRLAAVTDDHGVELRLFHGRGGSISRGGGQMNRALLALPRDTVTGPVKFTEQGEAIAEKFGNPRIAERDVEQMLNAQLRARLSAIEHPSEDVPEHWIEALSTMATAARTEYRDLITADGFVPYFETATPITVIEALHLGSRPASRTGERNVEDLRAIPWVFSWTQSRCILSGWYALGTGIEAYLEDGGDRGTLAEMYEQWAFFRTTLDNAALALARTDMEIAGEYAALADPDLRAEFFPRLEAEYERTVERVRSIVGRDSLIAREWLDESLDRRNPYVDPLNVLQARLLGQSHRSEVEERTLRLTVKGIAAGMKNTG